jgi:hypothetical protein
MHGDIPGLALDRRFTYVQCLKRARATVNRKAHNMLSASSLDEGLASPDYMEVVLVVVRPVLKKAAHQLRQALLRAREPPPSVLVDVMFVAYKK